MGWMYLSKIDKEQLKDVCELINNRQQKLTIRTPQNL